MDRPHQKVHRVGIERVHLAGEFETGDAVADIPQRGGAVLQHRLRIELDILQHAARLRGARHHGRRRRGRAPAGALHGRGRMDARPRCAGWAATATPSASSLAVNHAGADLVDQFEGAELPVVAKPHRLIDGLDVVGGVADQRRGVGQRRPQHAPGVAAMRAVMFEQARELALVQGLDLGLARRPELRRLQDRSPPCNFPLSRLMR